MAIIEKMFGQLCDICKKHRTKRLSYKNKFICADCEIKQIAQDEDKINCPICKLEMSKIIIEDVIIDKCKCGLFLEIGELEYLRKIADDKESLTRMSSFALGLASGTALGKL